MLVGDEDDAPIGPLISQFLQDLVRRVEGGACRIGMSGNSNSCVDHRCPVVFRLVGVAWAEGTDAGCNLADPYVTC